jgi:hypothetical protein
VSTLGQAGGTVSIGPYLLWVGVFLVVVVGAGLGVLAYRKVMLSSQAAESHSGILESLRKMRDRGQMTQAEYDATRKSIAAKAAGGKAAPVVAKPPTAGTVTARPGFDLTGAPLPKPPGNTPNSA